MHPGALALLRCPRCGADLVELPGTVTCDLGHAFDVARQGYVGLLEGDVPKHQEDDADMVQARDDVLAAGLLAPLTEALAQAAVVALADGPPGGLVDVGAGTGHHTAAVLEALAPSRAGVALDLSRPALRRAARAHSRLGAARADAWRGLPVHDGAAALALCVFAPRDGAELARVLAPGGALLVATPLADHLAELREGLGLLGVDPRKEERLARALAPVGEVEDERSVRAVVQVDRPAARAFAAMGPAARHVAPEELDARAADLAERTSVTVAITLMTVRRSC